MIGEYVRDSGVGSKKRSLTSPGNVAPSEGYTMSPPPKKFKQVRLPFKVIASPSPNQCDKPAAPSPVPSKKRKLSGTDRSQTPGRPANVKGTDGNSGAKKPGEHPAKKFFAKKTSSSPVAPKMARVETVDLDPEVSSSCADQEAKPTASSATPKRPLAAKPKSLESFLQTTQQPQVSTSDEVFALSDDEVVVIDEGSPGTKDDPSATETVAMDVASPHQESSQSATPAGKTSGHTPPASETEQTSTDNKDAQLTEDLMSAMDASMTCPDDCPAASKLSYDADSEDGEVDEVKIVKSSEGSSEAESSTGDLESNAGTTSPRGIAKPLTKTPLSAKALKKLKETEQLKEEKLRIRSEKKRKLQEQEAERKRQKLDLRLEKEREREEARRQKEMEKEVKRKERQLKKDQEDKEREQRRMAKEEERKKKQESIDAKMEEKRKKNEERLRHEEEKQKQEEEKREKEVKQKNFFKSFFKEAVAPIKKSQEKSCGWFAPFHVKDDVVLAPVRRCEKLPEDLQELSTSIQDQNSSSLYLEELRSTAYVVGKSGRTPRGESSAKEDIGQTVTPSAEKTQRDGDSQDVQIVSEAPAKPAETLVRVRCKLLQFHENYRPAYYGTWRRRSHLINPRNYLKKDEDLLDYEVDSDDEWEEPGESLSHSEGEDDGEEVDDGGESDDGFFVPHGYLSESEGCEDEEEAENWRERRAAKAKSWEVELKRQQGILKAVLVGCWWATGSEQSANRTLGAYKAVVLTTVPIDTQAKKQVASANEKHSGEESSKTLIHPKGQSSESGASLKRPVPAEAMPDLIRLVHGNTAGIKTLQREFREYWRRKEQSRMSGQSALRPETPTAVEAMQAGKTSSEASPTVGAEWPVSEPAGSGAKTPVLNEFNPGTASPNLRIPCREATPSSEEGTASQSPAQPIGDRSPECSISKRQLMITINDIAVREKRPEFPRTCWYVHQRVLEKYDAQGLPIPCRWQNLTKAQTMLRADSPLVGPLPPAYGAQTPSAYSVPAHGGYAAVVRQQKPVPQPVKPVLYVSNSSMHAPQPPGLIQGTLIPPSATSSALTPLCGVPSQSPVLQPSTLALPFQLQVANGMSASEIMQRLSATVPVKQSLSAPSLSTNPAHVFNPIAPNPLHYLSMLPAPAAVPSPETANKAAASFAPIDPGTSPNDIKAMLSSQVDQQTASPTHVKSDPKSTVAVAAATCASCLSFPEDKPTLTQNPNVKTLESFFSMKPPHTAQTDESNSGSESKKIGKDSQETKDAIENRDEEIEVIETN